MTLRLEKFDDSNSTLIFSNGETHTLPTSTAKILYRQIVQENQEPLDKLELVQLICIAGAVAEDDEDPTLKLVCQIVHRLDKAETGLKDMCAMVNEGLLVRDISHDHDSDWALKMASFTARLAAIMEPLPVISPLPPAAH